MSKLPPLAILNDPLRCAEQIRILLNHLAARCAELEAENAALRVELARLRPATAPEGGSRSCP